TVNCTVTSSGGDVVQCSFNVTVLRLVIIPHWFPQLLLPPPHSEYISPQKWHQLYASGIIISNVTHRRFLQSFPPPPPGGAPETHAFGSEVAGEVSMDGGKTFTPFSGDANVVVRMSYAGNSGDTQLYDTEMLSLNLTGPGGLMIRES